MEINKLLNPVTPTQKRNNEKVGERPLHMLDQDLDAASIPVKTTTCKAKSRITPRNLSNASRNAVKGPKAPKDQPRWKKQPTQGEVNYPVHPARSEKELQEFERFRIFPASDIADYCDHIPYNANNPKRSFFEKTGLTAFNVYQYQFSWRDKTHTVMWDYNVGLVKTTSFFKALGFAKTQPCKVKKENKGIEDVMHNVTGGAICAQGYWMPFNAARELAASFCHEIRYALVPVFGHDFPQLCAREGDADYRTFHISPATINHCIAEQEQWLRNSKDPKHPGPPLTPQQADYTMSPCLSPKTVLRLRTGKRDAKLEQLHFTHPNYRRSPTVETDSAYSRNGRLVPYSPDISPKTPRSPSLAPYMLSTPTLSSSNMSTSSAMIPGIDQTFLIHHAPDWTAINVSQSPLNVQRTRREQEAAKALIDLAYTPTPSPIRMSPAKKRLFQDYGDDDSVASDTVRKLLDGHVSTEEDEVAPTKVNPADPNRPLKRSRHFSV